MKWGITATSKGLLIPQYRALEHHIQSDLKIWDEWHHGDCIGGDVQSHTIVTSLKAPIRVMIHPPLDDKARAFCTTVYGTIFPEKPYLIRNHDIVDSVDRMFVCPSSMSENLRSGTWATYRYAKLVGRFICMIYPNGSEELILP